MAKAIKCDCCGKFIEIRDGTSIIMLTRDTHCFEKARYVNSHLEDSHSMEICHECDEAIGELFKSRHKDEPVNESI